MKKKRKPTLICKNCGARCTSRYCPECGQALAVGRLQNSTFFIDLMSSLMRINRGFLYTAANLLVHPWAVIRDYIRGRRIPYTPPLNMLILLCFFSTVVAGFTSAEITRTATVTTAEASSSAYRIGVHAAHFLQESPVVQILILIIPALIAVPIVYGRKGARRYNFAELFCALLYMADALLLFSVLTSPLDFIISDTATGILDLTYTLGIIGLSLYKAFPTAKIINSFFNFIAYLLLVLTFYSLIALSIYLFATV